MLLIVDFPSRSVIIRYFTFLFSMTNSSSFLLNLTLALTLPVIDITLLFVPFSLNI